MSGVRGKGGGCGGMLVEVISDWVVADADCNPSAMRVRVVDALQEPEDALSGGCRGKIQI